MLFKIVVILVAAGLIAALTWACSRSTPAGIGSWDDSYVDENETQ